jgi:hypothetical protein
MQRMAIVGGGALASVLALQLGGAYISRELGIDRSLTIETESVIYDTYLYGLLIKLEDLLPQDNSDLRILFIRVVDSIDQLVFNTRGLDTNMDLKTIDDRIAMFELFKLSELRLFEMKRQAEMCLRAKLAVVVGQQCQKVFECCEVYWRKALSLTTNVEVS